jgi:hypothetical protein
MELLTTYSQIERFITIKGVVIYASSGYDLVAIQQTITVTASITKKMPGKSISLTDSTCCINKAILFLASIAVDYIEEVLTSLDGQIKINE